MLLLVSYHDVCHFRYNFGQRIAQAHAAAGDVVAFDCCRFESRETSTGAVVGTRSAGSPRHCAVVKATTDSGRTIQVWEQNSGSAVGVVESSYNLGDLVEGSVEFYRALPSYPTLKGSISVRRPPRSNI
jgi:hypothetical protein